MQAWASPFTTRSDFAREWADDIAMEAILGNITTLNADGSYGNVWRITSKGIAEVEKGMLLPCPGQREREG